MNLSSVIYFYSIEFLLFLLLSLLFYWNLPRRFQNRFLLLISYLFYASWDFRFLGLVLISTIVDYFCSQKIHLAQCQKERKSFLVISLVTNLSLLGFFKYFNFFIDSFNELIMILGFSSHLQSLEIILPLGISFYTFQTISYSVDVYKKHTVPVSSFWDFSLYVSYFPQIIAGPIERSTKLIPQLLKTREFSKVNFQEGIYLFCFGLFKKSVLADSFQFYVDKMAPQSETIGIELLFSFLAFSLQVYLDFSGYTCMARGISKFFGIELSKNFSFPYFARNPSEFWNSWHMTLSHWVKFYLFTPLLVKWRNPYLAALLSFLVIGFWHGPYWHYIVWGLYWYLFTVLYQLLSKKWPLLTKKSGTSKFFELLLRLPMFFIIIFGMALFNSKSLSHYFDLLHSILYAPFDLSFLSSGYILFFYSWFLIMAYEVLLYFKKDEFWILKKNYYVKLLFYIIIYLNYRTYSGVGELEFIYFQF
jgi:alginate O-acetyltransferase complex protein AlgI